jgi:malonate transporter and related proteins
MGGVLEGFLTIGAVIVLGVLLAHRGVLNLDSQVQLSRLSFYVASPALMVTVLADADLAEVFSQTLTASVAGVIASGGLYVLAARTVWRRDLAHTVIGALSSMYVNAGNLGLPIAAYVLGDATLVAPILLMQMLVIQPIALVVLDHATATTRIRLRGVLLGPLTNPLTVASLVGVALSLSGITLPPAVSNPLELVGGMAVPGMLLAYGVSLRLGPRPGHGTSLWEIGYITTLKLVVQPAGAYVVGRFVLGLSDPALFAVTVLAALPTAQNIFVHATRYSRAVVVARDSIFLTTMLSVPALLVIAAVLA